MKQIITILLCTFMLILCTPLVLISNLFDLTFAIINGKGLVCWWNNVCDIWKYILTVYYKVMRINPED